MIGCKEGFDCSCIKKIPKKQREGWNTGEQKCNLSISHSPMYSMCEENLLFCKAQDQYLLLHVHPKALITNRKKYGVNNQMECMDQVKNSNIRETT